MQSHVINLLLHSCDKRWRAYIAVATLHCCVRESSLIGIKYAVCSIHNYFTNIKYAFGNLFIIYRISCVQCLSLLC